MPLPWSSDSRAILRRRCGLAVLAASIGVCLVLTAVAEAKRVAVAGVRLGMTKKDVRDVLGSPRSTSTRQFAGRYVTDWRYIERLTITFGTLHGDRKPHVEEITTYSPKDSFPNGVRVGSPLKDIKGRFKPLLCGPNGAPDTIVCQWFPQGRKDCAPLIYWWLRDKKVYRIQLVSTTEFESCPDIVKS